MENRAYQQEILARVDLSNTSRDVIKAPTGAGKTYIATQIVHRFLEEGKRVAFTVPLISLVNQTVRSFWDQGIQEIGVMQAGHEMTNHNMPVQVCSIDTIARRRHYPEIEAVIVDECHRRSKFLYEWMDKWNNVPFIGLSATPWTVGLGNHFKRLINLVGTQDLIDQKYLCDFKVFAPSAPDLTGVKVITGHYGKDYVQRDLSGACDDIELIASIVETWKEKAEWRPTILYAVDRAHAGHLAEEFSRNGVPAGYIDAFTPIEEREVIGNQLKNGDIAVVCNVGCLTTGLDWPFVGCIILARPTKSRILFVQMIGRGLRVAEHKDNLLILDHSSSHEELGFVTDIDSDILSEGEDCWAGDKDADVVKVPKECPKCKMLKPIGVHECPECGFAPAKQTDIQERDGELIELDRKMQSITAKNPLDWYAQLLTVADERGYKPAWAYWTVKEKFSDVSLPYLDSNIPRKQPTAEVERYVKYKRIRYAKSRPR